MQTHLLNIPINILVIIDKYLSKKPERYLGKNINTKLSVWEYLVMVNKNANKICFDNCYKISDKMLSKSYTPISISNYKESLKIYRALSFEKEPIKYILYYNVVTCSYYNTINRVWEVYRSNVSGLGNDDECILKLLGLLTSSIYTDWFNTITEIDNKCWNYFSNFLENIFDICLPCPKIGDKVVCNYKLKYPEILVNLTAYSYMPYKPSDMYMILTKEHINVKNIKSLVVDNIDKHIYYCYHYDDCCGERIIDSIDEDLYIYQEQLDKIVNC